ncbi:MAG: hypothetical protein COX79_05760 [Candidatus Levybacteria bacterium CG_4_10_14_0_2_um_filter_36_16]|nr:MAG: hypothetical protein AUK12_01230 [Candidatus Levybacteria bacterium CG2_30_37_29]PIR78760.1 MAG: hypothetical protein COU26_04980 [Candidatus Levybacteria bacterium CG10_big_fil_rev_8_21_14_0_10_36_30]PIZ96175.1 MAG: hypothetical protein COX79_05760 [Candidatus Levybacteria bacterium CG_4_10_14_0_2_um_filter_36_16]PJA90590.1 MAG: hypothetical protein CO136_01670 [Candidatus Levybacteria bacterium CG_4_9_14_3_um_filter_36_7]
MNPIIQKAFESLTSELLSSQTVGIVVGENATIDKMAAGLSLYLSLSAGGKNVQIISKSNPTVEVSNLVGIDRVGKNFEGNTKILTISVPYREGEIEKVSYNIEKDKLNVNLFAEENGISFSERDVEFIGKGSTPSLVIALGIPSAEKLQEVSGPEVKIVNIDTSLSNTQFGDIVLVDSSFSSFSEIVSEIIKSLGLPMDQDIAQNLLDGITYATNNFTSPSTSAYAFGAAGILLMNGAKRTINAPKINAASFPQPTQLLGNQNRGQMRQNNQQRTGQMMQNNRNNNQNRGGFQKNDTRRLEEMVQKMKSQEEMQKPKIEQSPIENVEREASSDVPDDWFLPKVFKGAKKNN